MKSTVVLLSKSQALTKAQLTILFFKCRGTALACESGMRQSLLKQGTVCFRGNPFARGTY